MASPEKSFFTEVKGCINLSGIAFRESEMVDVIRSIFPIELLTLSIAPTTAPLKNPATALLPI